MPKAGVPGGRDAERPMDRLRGGARRLILSNPARLDYITQGLADITGYTRQEMHDLFDDEFGRIVHPDDRAAFDAFDEELRSGETALSLRYRIVRKDGAVVPVQDTIDSHQLADGTVVGYSLVVELDADSGQVAVPDAPARAADSPGWDAPAGNATLASAAAGATVPVTAAVPTSAPYGVVEFDAGDYSLAYVSNRMWEMLGVSNPDAYLREMRNGALTLVPSVDHARLAKNLESLRLDDEPCALDVRLWHSEGYLIEVAGWATLVKGPKGRMYRLVLVDATRQRSRERKHRRALRVEHFRRLYDILFLFDTAEQSALCYKYEGGAPLTEAVPFDTNGSIRIVLSDALAFLVGHLAAESDQDQLGDFFRPLMAASGGARGYGAPAKPSADSLERMKKRIVFSSSTPRTHASYEGTLIDAEAGAFFFGCRRFVDESQAQAPYAEAAPGRALCLPTAQSGTVLVSVEGDRTHILFANERGRALFAGNAISGSMMSMDGLLKICPITREQMGELMSRGEFTVTGVRSSLGITSWRLVRVRESESSTRDLVMVFELPSGVARSLGDAAPGGPEAAGSPAAPDADVFIRTFGYFDVFLNGKAVVFNSSKAKELLALLVDRRGGYVSPSEAITYLWEDEAATPVVLSRHRKVAMRMKNTLAENGIGHIVETVKGKRCLNVAAVRCDLYDYLAGDPDVSFSGTYLQNYSWGEITLSELLASLPFHS